MFAVPLGLWNEPFSAGVGNTHLQQITSASVHQHVWTPVILLWKQHEVFPWKPRLVAVILIQLSASLQVYSTPSVYRRPTTLNNTTHWEVRGIQLCLWTIRGKISPELYIGLRSILNFSSSMRPLFRSFSEMPFDLSFVLRELKAFTNYSTMLHFSFEEDSLLWKGRKRERHVVPPPQDQSLLEQGQPQTLRHHSLRKTYQ